MPLAMVGTVSESVSKTITEFKSEPVAESKPDSIPNPTSGLADDCK